MKGVANPLWNNASVLCILHGKQEEDVIYRKSIAFQLHVTGYELPDTVMILSKKGVFYVLSSAGKCRILEPVREASEKAMPSGTFGGIKVELFSRSKTTDCSAYHSKMVSSIAEGGELIMGTITKDLANGPIVDGWIEASRKAGVQTVDVTIAIGIILATKDTEEIDLLRKSAALTSKVMKIAFIEKMEDVIENDSEVTHFDLSQSVTEVILSPIKIKLKIDSADVETSYHPVVQSGGDYDLKLTAESNKNILKPDIIIASIGARYRSYCGTITRSFFVDAPKRIVEIYAALLQTHSRCADSLRSGVPLKEVMAAAHNFLKERYASLIPHLTRTLGCALGLDFKEKAMDINAKNTIRAREGMVFTLHVGFHDVPLSETDRKGSSINFEKFSIAIGDMVLVKRNEPAETLTKVGKEWTNVCYTLASSDNEKNNDDSSNEAETNRHKSHMDIEDLGERRLRDRGNTAEVQDMLNQREVRMSELLKRKAKERASEMARRGKDMGEDSEEEEVEDLLSYDATDQYPKDTMPHQIKTDIDREVVIVPINGQPVPFSIHTIKNVVMPEPDNHSFYLRINFFAPGQTLAKDASRRMAKLVERFGKVKYAFVRELTFRSLDQTNLGQAFRQIQELRRRLRLREQKAVEEADLVSQAKLIRMTDARVPRLSDLTLRPNISGKTVGALESHTNGLRFISLRGETVEILYANIRLAVFQPCEGVDTKVVLHFHLRHPIMVGKKAHKDIQVYTEAVDSTVNLDSARRSHYDPDEIMEEQQDKKLRKRLN